MTFHPTYDHNTLQQLTSVSGEHTTAIPPVNTVLITQYTLYIVYSIHCILFCVVNIVHICM